MIWFWWPTKARKINRSEDLKPNNSNWVMSFSLLISIQFELFWIQPLNLNYSEFKYLSFNNSIWMKLFTWNHFGFAWTHLNSLGLTWTHLDSLGLIWLCLDWRASLGSTWAHWKYITYYIHYLLSLWICCIDLQLLSNEFIWIHVDSLWFTWTHSEWFNSPASTWAHLNSFGYYNIIWHTHIYTLYIYIYNIYIYI